MGNFDGSADWIRGRIHLSSITDKYKKKIKIEKENCVKEAFKTAIAPTVAFGIPRRHKRTMALKIKWLNIRGKPSPTFISVIAVIFVKRKLVEFYSIYITFNIFHQHHYSSKRAN